MNVADCGIAGNSYSYEARRVSLAAPGSFDKILDSQRENFLQEYITEGEEEEDKKDDKLVDYLLKALEGEEKELRMEGNSYMDDEERKKFLIKHCPELFADLT